MAIKITFEIGHVASLKSKVLPDGFTHEWELFVRGCESNDISHCIDKVVFNLHESFPKPKRVVKEPPYILKESGYASFELAIDIYFKHEQKKTIFLYDLGLQKTGTVTNSERKTFTFKNPSDDFRRKLLKNGGQPITVGGADEKSREMDDRSQLISKPKLGGNNEPGTNTGGGGGSSSSSGSKKHKSKSDDSKNPNSFATLFGAPIQKTSTKVSPDPKAHKSSPNLIASTKSQSQKSEKSSKEKSSDKERKEKNKHSSPAKGPSSGGSGADVVKESKKQPSSDDKHEKREEKKKDKTHSKERERSRDKLSKRVPSPKPKSPKRQSPVRPTSSTSKPEEPSTTAVQLQPNPVKQLSKHSSGGTTETDRPSSSAKKSKKEKKEKSHDKDRDKDKKEKEHKVKDDRSTVVGNNKSAADKIDASKKDGNNTPKDIVSKDKASKIQESKFTSVVPPPEPAVIETNTVKAVTPTVEKKPEKDPDRKHKHKKKDKNKERGEKDGKDRKKEKTSKTKEDNSATQVAIQKSVAQPPQQQPPSTSSFPLSVAAKKVIPDIVATHSMQPIVVQPPPPPAAAAAAVVVVPTLPAPVQAAVVATKITPLNALLDEIGDKGSSDSEDDHLLTAPETLPDHVTASSVCIPEPIVKKPPPPEVLPPPPLVKPEKADKEEKTEKSAKRGRKESKANIDKDEKKRKRKTKDETQTAAATKRKTPSPAAIEPPAKLFKKEEPIRTSDTASSMASYSAAPLSPTPPPLPPPHTDASAVTKASPQSTSNRIESPSQPRPLSAASSTITVTAAAAAAAATAAATVAPPPPPPPVRSSTPCNVTSTTASLSDYMSELKDLQHKIMTLQDNNELQQVVEMIATTGCYEITTKTFDFDLCALDRTTVQRLQDFFSTTSCS